MSTEEEKRYVADLLFECEETDRRLGLLAGRLSDLGKKPRGVAERMEKGEPWPQDAETFEEVWRNAACSFGLFRDKQKSRRTS